LRIALTLPGGIATGAFEAGAVGALLAWTQEVNARTADSVVVDVIAGASGGALTGLLAARVLLAGDDPVDVFHRAWVAAPSLRALRGTDRWAPLSLRTARNVAHKLVFAPRGRGWPRRQTAEVKLDLALGCLRGLASEIALNGVSEDRRRPLLATSYLDWSRFALDQAPDGSQSAEEKWRGAIDSALASASHPLAFRARELNREIKEYLGRGIVNLPAGEEPLRLWYTDGGLFDNEPFGRCLARVAEVDTGDTPSRLVILLRAGTRSPIPSDNPAWTAKGRPRWTQTLWRVLDLVATHAADQDLQHLETVNARLRWTNHVAAAIAEVVAERDETYDHLRQVLSTIMQERGQPDLAKGEDPVSASAGRGNLAELVESLVRAASGLDDKRHVHVAVFAPDPASLGPPSMGGVVGFIQRGHREDRFVAGFRSMLNSITESPRIEARVGRELTIDAAAAAQSKVHRSSDGRAAWLRSPGISRRDRFELTQLGFRVLKIAWRDLDDYLDKRESRQRGAVRRRSSR